MASPGTACPHCGTPYVPGARFCQVCGTPAPYSVPGGVQSPGAAPLPTAAPLFPPIPPGAPIGWSPLPPGAVFVPSTVVRDRERTVEGLLFIIIGTAISWIPYVDIIGGLIALIGIILVFMGRRAYGPDHHRDVVAGGVLFLVTILATIGLAIALVSALLGAASVSTTGSVTFNSSALIGALEGTFIAAAVVGIIGGLSKVIMVYALADKTTRIILWAGFFLSVAVSILVLLILYPQVVNAVNSATSGSTFNSGPITSLSTESDLLGAINIVPVLLFVWAYWRARVEALRRTASPTY